jgi:hypothetical protein
LGDVLILLMGMVALPRNRVVSSPSSRSAP